MEINDELSVFQNREVPEQLSNLNPGNIVSYGYFMMTYQLLNLYSIEQVMVILI
jgi:hypothetical protein